MNPEEAITGVRVRILGAPERTGTIISQQPREQGGVWSVRVHFDTGVQAAIRVANLELLPSFRDIRTDILMGQLEGPKSLRQNLLHEKLHGRLSEVMYSMDAADTTFYAYQFKPIIKLLESPTNSLLVADEVGLGKTIEAGLIWTELRAREGARTLLVVCPPHLITKWRNELKRRFGVDAKHGTPKEVLEALDEARRGVSPGFAYISSYHGLRPPREWDDGKGGDRGRLAEKLSNWAHEEEPFLDLLVMDEAAIMRNSESQTSKLGALLTPISRYKVYLSATPLHTNAKNLYTLLRRLDPDTFPDVDSFKSILEANEPLVRLRKMILGGNIDREQLLEQLDLAKENALLAESSMLADLRATIEASESLADPNLRASLAHRSERANLLSYVVTRTRKREVDLNPVTREVNTVLVELKTHEQELYQAVTDAVWEYAEDKEISTGFLTVMPQRQISSSMAAACARLVDGTPADEECNDELNPDISLSRLKGNAGPLVSYVRRKLAGSFRTEDFVASDSKYECLIAALRTHWSAHPDSKVVLFAFFKPTLRYLKRRLGQDGISSLLLTGDETGDKQLIVDEFSRPETARVLLSSEVGSEGLDLQFATALVNYDLPWNPMVVEQRIGRIHRIGQAAERIVVINLICQGTVDERIYTRLYERLHLFQETLGDLEAVVGPLINKLTQEMLSTNLTPEQQAQRIENTALAMEARIQMEMQLENEASILAAYGDYVTNQITAAHERKDWINGTDLENYIRMFFQRNFPATRLQGVDQNGKIFSIELDLTAGGEFGRFITTHKLQGQSRITGGDRRLIRFDHRVFASQAQGIEVVHQSHPLVRFAGHYLRINQLMQPAPVAIDVPADRRPPNVAPGLYAFVSQRWAVEGLRTFEKIHHEVRLLSDESAALDEHVSSTIVEVAAAEGEDSEQLLSEGDELLTTLSDYVDHLEFAADSHFHEFEERCRVENQDRCRIQTRGIERFLERGIESLQQIIQTHRMAGREGLAVATEGKIEVRRKKCADLGAKIEAKSQTRGDAVTIAAGFIEYH
jgi:superfamily II DNA or RNA helicase